MEKLNNFDDYVIKILSDILRAIDMSIVSQMTLDIVIASYKVSYLVSVFACTILSFLRLVDERSQSNIKGAKRSAMYIGLVLGMGFAFISVVRGSTTYPISLFFVSVGVNRYLLSKEVDIFEVIKKDYRHQI